MKLENPAPLPWPSYMPPCLYAGFDPRLVGLSASVASCCTHLLTPWHPRRIDAASLATALEVQEGDIGAAIELLVRYEYLVPFPDGYVLSCGLRHVATDNYALAAPHMRPAHEVSPASSGRRSEFSERGATATYRKKMVSAGVIACEACDYTPRHRKKLHVHHIRPISRGGTTVAENLVALCFDCHNDAHELDRAGKTPDGTTRDQIIDLLRAMAKV